jgi:hypothetical protein
MILRQSAHMCYFENTAKGFAVFEGAMGKAFRPIRAGRIEFGFARSNYAPEFGDFWCFLTMCKKQKAPQIQYLQGF